MKIFSHVIPAQSPRTHDSLIMSYVYAATLTIMALSQLFSFEGFLALLESFSLPGGAVTAHLIGSFLVVCEVFALPFLLRLALSPLMRIVSMILSWIVPVLWFLLSMWLTIITNAVNNIGFFGTVVHVMPGAWAVFVSLAFGVIALWSTYGLWPFPAKRH